MQEQLKDGILRCRMHGNSLSHRAPGSIGQCQTPGRVWKGKKMSGHMGFEKVTIQNLEISSLDQENQLVLIKGSIPGAPGSRVFIRPSRGVSVLSKQLEDPAPKKETKTQDPVAKKGVKK